MKLGRNQPCWCGSGEKYKRCHLDREKQEPLSISEGLSALREAWNDAACNCPDQLRSECSGPPINSHSLAKSLGLKAMSVKGHIFGIKHDFQTLKRTQGRAEVGSIGINKISIFPGFCAHHDSLLFKEIETETFQASAKQCALLSYRAIARERHAKRAGININDFLRGSDKGRHALIQLSTQSLLSLYGQGLSLARDDLDQAVNEHHQSILSDQYNRFESLALRFTDFPVLCSTGHMPSDDWSGSIVQDLSDVTLKASWVSAVSFKSEGKSWVVFTWLKSAGEIARFVDSLLENYYQQMSDALVKYFFSISENLAVQPSWWLSLDERQRAALELRITDGLPIDGGANITAPKQGEPIVATMSLEEVRRIQ